MDKKPQLEDKSCSYRQLLQPSFPSRLVCVCVGFFCPRWQASTGARPQVVGRHGGGERREEGMDGGYSLTEMEKRGREGEQEEEGCWSIIHQAAAAAARRRWCWWWCWWAGLRDWRLTGPQPRIKRSGRLWLICKASAVFYPQVHLTGCVKKCLKKTRSNFILLQLWHPAVCLSVCLVAKPFSTFCGFRFFFKSNLMRLALVALVEFLWFPFLFLIFMLLGVFKIKNPTDETTMKWNGIHCVFTKYIQTQM